MIGNKRDSVTVQNQEMDYNETFIYVPKSLGVDDVIVLHNEPEFKYNGAFAGLASMASIAPITSIATNAVTTVTTV